MSKDSTTGKRSPAKRGGRIKPAKRRKKKAQQSGLARVERLVEALNAFGATEPALTAPAFFTKAQKGFLCANGLALSGVFAVKQVEHGYSAGLAMVLGLPHRAGMHRWLAHFHGGQGTVIAEVELKTAGRRLLDKGPRLSPVSGIAIAQPRVVATSSPDGLGAAAQVRSCPVPPGVKGEEVRLKNLLAALRKLGPWSSMVEVVLATDRMGVMRFGRPPFVKTETDLLTKLGHDRLTDDMELMLNNEFQPRLARLGFASLRELAASL